MGQCGQEINFSVATLAPDAAPARPSWSYTSHDLCMPTYEARVVAADFDQDGNTDLGVVSSFDDKLLVMWGDGDGGFAPEETEIAGLLGGLVPGTFGDGGAVVLARIDAAKLVLVPVSDLGR